MSLPSISCITPVYGGVAWLEQAMACFLAQDYQGPHEMLIVNSCPQQTLMGDFPNVRIINLGFRPPSLGDLRNICVMDAWGERIVIWDSDDIMLPNHLSNFAAHHEGNDWLWLTPQFWVLGEDVQSIVPGACPLFSYTKRAWELAGKYPNLTVGEDAKLISAITEKFKGQKVKLPDEQISFCYRWGQESHHVSGEGHDRPGIKSAHDRAHDALQERIKRGLEKTGTIWLQPRVTVDWGYKTKKFLELNANGSKKKRVALVELGRFGDICNILPIAQHIAERYGKPHFVVSKEFAQLLEGCSYVEPHPLDLRNHEINKALTIAQKEFDHVICAQIWGDNFEIVKTCASYNRESWRLAGFAHKFDDRTWRPLFDQRDLAREEALWRKLDDGRPMILCNVTKSVSSPYPYGQALLQFIRCCFTNENVVDVADLVLPQIYDLVGIIDRARCLVTIDTATLHLAAATNTPVVAITNAQPWLGTEPRCRVVRRMTYGSSDRCVVDAIRDGLAMHHSPVFRDPPAVAPERRILHVVERHNETNPKEQVRKAAAWASWDVLYADGVTPAHLWNYPRNALSIGDIRPLPFLKDLLKHGMDQANDEDIILWTNDDNYLHKELAAMLQLHVSLWDVCTSQRIEFRNASFPSSPKPPDVWRQFDSGHMGRDLFAATKWWLKAHWDEIPDFILGASDFDLCLACIVRGYMGIEVTRANLESTMWPAELPRGYVAHQYHDPKWREPKNIHEGAAQLHNRMAFKAWAKDRLPHLQFNIHGCI